MSDRVLESGFWCEYEGLYFTDRQEHETEQTWLKRGSGPLGHFGYECEGRAETIKVKVVGDE